MSVLNGLKTLAPSASSMAPTIQPVSPLERLRQRIAAAADSVRQRFTTAAQAFQARVEFERAVLPPRAPAVVRERRFAGALFPVDGGEPIVLFEGTASGFRVERDFLQCLESEGPGAGERFHTNEWVRLGTRKYLLKLLDENCRAIVTEGENR